MFQDSVILHSYSLSGFSGHIRHTFDRLLWGNPIEMERAMSYEVDHQRRRLLGVTAITLAVSQFGMTAIANAQTSAVYSSTPKEKGHSSFASLKQIRAGVLNIGYAEAGPAAGPVVLLVHGWPYDIHSYVDVAPILADAGYRVIIPYLRGYGTTRFISNETPRNGQQAALAADMIGLMDALGIEKAILGGCDWGARTVNIMAALRPDRCKAMVSVSGYLIGSQEINKKPLAPKAELAWWYQFYFATERGRLGYVANRYEFASLIWRTASPAWKFDDETFNRSARALDNSDHVDITIHNYRWRLGLAEGEPKYDDDEKKLAMGPLITIPTITMEGDANGAPHPEPSSYAKKFAGKYEHRNVGGGIGHNLPQEAPRAFAQAILDVAKF
jgi:pimeloyl-ACP methyl ester carboxylesterase